MKSRASRVTLSVCFLALLYLPTLAWLLFGGHLKDENFEKRELASWPNIAEEEISRLPNAFSRYYDDHLPFRNQLISGYVALTRTLFDTDLYGTVIFGKDGWLFYSSVSDGNPVRSYRGEDLLTQNQLRKIAGDLRKKRDMLKQKGIDFVLYIAPNKERVYAEYMPDRFGPPAENYAARQLVDFLKAHTDLTVLYPYDALMTAKEAFPDVPLYHPTDTHWNDVGAYIGTKLLCDALDAPLPELAAENILVKEDGFVGDLVYLSLQTYTVGPQQAYELTGLQLPEKNGKRILIQNDSFSDNMQPLLEDLFTQSIRVHHSVYTDDVIDQYHPDVMIMELNERFLRRRLL